MTFRLQALSAWINTIPTAWWALGVICALAVAVMGFVQMPKKLDAHIVQADTIIFELRKGNLIAEQNQCIAISPPKDWPECLRIK
jgi:hypothetical protein